MTERPKFGAGSMNTKQHKQEPKEEKVVETPNAFLKPKTEETVSSPVQKSFGAGTSDSADEVKTSGIGDIFKNQGIPFWIISYVASFLIYNFLSSEIGILKIMNLLLFPFTLILFAQIQVFFTGSMNRLARWIAPDFRTYGAFSSGFGSILWYISKLFFYYCVWGFSYVLGIIGIIMIFVTNNKVNR